MMNVTLAELRPLVRSQAGVERIRYISDADLSSWIVNAAGRHYDEYLSCGDPYFEKEIDLTIDIAGAATLPSTFYRLRRVDDPQGVELDDLDVHDINTPLGTRGLRGYRLRSNELQLPGSSAGQVFHLVYAPKFVEPRDAAGNFIELQPFDVVDGKGREWVVLQAAIRALGKQREDTTGLAQEAAVLRRDISTRASKRTTSKLHTVADVASQDYEDPYLTGWPRRRWPWR